MATPPLDGALELGPATVLPSLGAATVVVRGFAEPELGVRFFQWCTAGRVRRGQIPSMPECRDDG